MKILTQVGRAVLQRTSCDLSNSTDTRLSKTWPTGTTAAGPLLHDNGISVSLALKTSVPAVYLVQGHIQKFYLGIKGVWRVNPIRGKSRSIPGIL